MNISQYTADTLVTVKDMYGKKFYVTPEDLNGTKTQIRLYHPRTKRRFEFEDTPHGGVTIHRGNICTHPRSEFVRVTIFGDTWKVCPVCDKSVKDAISQAQADFRAEHTAQEVTP